jgi:hypothetical protein
VKEVTGSIYSWFMAPTKQTAKVGEVNIAWINIWNAQTY